MDWEKFTEEVSAEMAKVREGYLKRLKEQDDSILHLKKQIGDYLAGGNGRFEARSIHDLLIAEKTLIDRPLTMERGQTHIIKLQAKDIIGVSRGFPEALSIVAGGPRVPLGVQNLIPTSSTGAGAITFLQETSFTNMAAPVAEGAAKPKSEKTFTPVTKPIEVIAHYFKISRQSWEDLPQVAAQINSNGIYGLNVKTDQQLLKGSGVAPQLGPGLYTIATAAGSLAPGTSMIDRLFLAAAELTAAGWLVDGVAMNAADYASMLISKSTTGEYVYNASVPLPPIVTSPALAAGEFLVGGFNQAHVFMRAEASVQVATQNEDDFITNRLTALAETRLALAVYQAGAFRKNGPLA